MSHITSLPALYALSENQITVLLETLYQKGFKSEMKLVLDSLEKSNVDINLQHFREKLSTLIVVSVHQPGLLPWPGYFHKVFYSDHFVWLDHVNIARKNFVSRVPISSFSGKKYLILPLKKHSHMANISSLEVVDDQWKQTHLGQLSFYRKAPFFDHMIDKISQWYASIYSRSLVQINWTLFNMILELLDMHPSVSKSSSMDLASKKEQLMIEITKKLGGTVYFSGMRAAEYQSSNNFYNSGLRLIYQNFYEYQQIHSYKQDSLEFSNGLSILDSLFYLGPQQTRRHIEQYNHYSLGQIIGEVQKTTNQIGFNSR